MRKLILQMQVTLDGFVSAKDGDVSWAFPAFDEEFTRWAVDSLWSAGLHVMGAETGRGLAAYWPAAEIEERDRPFAPAMNQIPKVVFSRSIDRLDWNGTRIARGDLAAEMERLKREPGKPILAHGGARFAQSLCALGLVDEYQLVVHPVVLGEGLRLFSSLEQPLRLRLL